jgi:hypothetical protein
VFLLVGAALQIIFWKTPANTYLDALGRHPYLWVIYLFLAFFTGEPILRLIKRHKK